MSTQTRGGREELQRLKRTKETRRSSRVMTPLTTHLTTPLQPYLNHPRVLGFDTKIFKLQASSFIQDYLEDTATRGGFVVNILNRGQPSTLTR